MISQFCDSNHCRQLASSGPECCSQCVAVRCVGVLVVGLCLTGCGRFGYDNEPVSTTVAALCTNQDGLVEAFNLHPRVALANVIHWRFDRGGAPDDFSRYALVVAEGLPDFELGRATVFSPEVNPELGSVNFFTRIDPFTTELWTMSDGHLPGTDYYAQLVAIDVEGNCTTSEVVMATTDVDYTESVVVHSDDPTLGFSMPSDYKLSQTAPYQGSSHYEWAHAGDLDYQNVRRKNMDIDISAMTAVNFDRAVFEYAVRVDSATTAHYASARISFGRDTGEVYSFHPYALRGDGTYRVYQAPLREMIGYTSKTMLTFADTVGQIDEAGIGMSLADQPAGTVISVDEARIRW